MDFELKGYQERNIETLLKTLSSKEANKTITELAKIEKQEWAMMGLIMSNVKDITENGLAGLTDIGVGEELLSSLKDTLKTELNSALAPLKNELMDAINTLLEPIMPYLEWGINTLATMISVGTSALRGLITGNFSDLNRTIEQLFPGANEWKANEFIPDYYNQYAENQVVAWEYNWRTGHRDKNPEWVNRLLDEYGSFAAYDAAATAAGTYSGQFDIDTDVLENLLNNMNLDFNMDEEEE